MQSDNGAGSTNHILLPLVDENEENVVFPLVLNVLTRFWGEEVPYSEIKKRSVQYNNFKGTIFIEGLELLDKLNLSFIVYRGSISDLKKRVSQGFPMIVILPGIGDIIQFATIVCGYDEKEERVITYVPEPDSYGAIPVNKFIDEWSQEDYFSILIFPKDMYDIFKNESFQFSDSNKIYLETERMNLQGKIQESITLLNSFIDKSLSENNNTKTNPHVLYLLASILNEKNDEKCVSLYESVIKLNPKFYLAYRGLGNYYLKNKNYLLSKENYIKAIEINPQRYGSIYKNLGIVFLEIGDNIAARESFKTYLKFIPNAKDKDNILEFLNS